MATKFITVSIEIMHDKNLNQSQKFLLSEIEQLQTLKHGCIASNAHFSELIGITKVNVSRNLSDLEAKGYINIEVTNGSRNHDRVIKTIRPPYQNDKTPLSKRQETIGNRVINKTINIPPNPQKGGNVGSKNIKKTVDERRKGFYNKISEYLGKYKKETLRDFYDHWSTLGDKDKKMAFEKCKTWNTERRLATWVKNNFNGTENNIVSTVKPTSKGTGVFSQC